MMSFLKSCRFLLELVEIGAVPGKTAPSHAAVVLRISARLL